MPLLCELQRREAEESAPGGTLV